MMRQFSKHSAVVLALCYSSWGLVYIAEEFKQNESLSCTPLTPDSSLNTTWMQSVGFWNIPLWNKKELFLSIKLSTTPEEFSNITESELKKTCLVVSRLAEAPEKIEFHGLKRKFFDWQASYPLFRDGVINWAQNGVYQMTSVVVLTDNKSYILGIDEFCDGSKGFYVFSVSDDVAEEEWKKIYERIGSLGFSKNSTFRLESKCDDDEYVKQLKATKRN